MKKVLFVCIGNICRSPVQQYVFEEIAKKLGLEGEFVFDSCGISSWHIGEDADPRMRLSAEKKRYSFPKHRAKLFQRKYFQEFDYIFAVTEEVYETLSSKARGEYEKSKIHLATHFSERHKGKEIPDPYTMEQKDFDAVLEMIEELAEETLCKLGKNRGK